MKKHLPLVMAAFFAAISVGPATGAGLREVDLVYQFPGTNNPSPRPRVIRLDCGNDNIIGYRIIYPTGEVPGFGKDPHTPLLFKYAVNYGCQIQLHMAGLFDPRRGNFPVTFRFYCMAKDPSVPCTT